MKILVDIWYPAWQIPEICSTWEFYRWEKVQFSLHYFLPAPPCAAAPSRKWSRVWEAICLYSLILSGKINHESRFFATTILVFLFVWGFVFSWSALLRGAFLAEGRHAQWAALLQNDKLRITNWPLKGHSRTRPHTILSNSIFWEHAIFYAS